MTKNLTNADKFNKLVDEFFKEFKNESLVWTGYLWVIRRKGSEQIYLEFLNKHHNFQIIHEFMKNDFFKCDLEEFEDFLKECRESKLSYIPNEDLNFLKDQDRLCWFLINQIEYKYKNIKDKKYRYENAYFSLLFLIHIKLDSNRITLNDIREYIKTLGEKKNLRELLSTYINDNDFISWALNYTDTKYRIRTQPNFKPKDNKEKLDIFLAYWDNEFVDNKYRYEVEINTLKKAWQQKQFRDKGGLKKPYHLPLSKKTKSQLEILAEKMNISETKVLEKLIEGAYKNEMLDEKGKALY